MYRNAIITKSLPSVSDTSRKKRVVKDVIKFPQLIFSGDTEESKKEAEEVSLESLNIAVKRLHERLKKGYHIDYIVPLDVFVTL
jgi:hypothetical protein